MKCVIPGANVKVLARAIHALAKIGDEMYVQPQERALSFRSVAASNSAYCDITFRDIFFSYYSFGNLEEEDALKCKVAMRGAIAVFKATAVLDKLVETCHIKLHTNAANLIIILKYKNGVIKTFLLPILNCENLQASYDKEGLPNHLIVQPKVLADAVLNFPQNLIEITLDVTAEKILIRNYVNDAASIGTKVTRTQLALAIGEFDTYTIGQDACVTICMKEVKAILAFAEAVMLPIHIVFEVAGKPVVFVLRNQSFEMNLLLSTLNPDSTSITHDSIQERRQAIMKRGLKRTPKPRAKSRKITSKTSATTSDAFNDASVSRRGAEKNGEPPRNRGSKRQIEENHETLVELVRSTSINNGEPSVNHPQEPSQAFTSSTTTTRRTRTDLISETPSSAMTTPPQTRISSRVSIASMFTASSADGPGDDRQKNTNNNDLMDDDWVPNSPPRRVISKKAKMMFQKCFQATFDPSLLSGHEGTLVEDSDDSN